eukprot:gb/GEZN01009189.1/.p1 GENE.gb/GEZN01009189.1/~~gb/GEZN01009189.1/.p1  ORF type:complete len:403 (+),score=25.89 gb/GEZN01009189.1/:113-1321(+)
MDLETPLLTVSAESEGSEKSATDIEQPGAPKRHEDVKDFSQTCLHSSFSSICGGKALIHQDPTLFPVPDSFASRSEATYRINVKRVPVSALWMGSDVSCLTPDSSVDKADVFTYVSFVSVIATGFLYSSITLKPLGTVLLMYNAALLPGVVLIFFFYLWNNRKLVRMNTMVRAFILGWVGAFAWGQLKAILLSEAEGIVLDDSKAPPDLRTACMRAFVEYAVPEETLKYFILQFFYLRHVYTKGYGLTLICISGALGYACFENMYYVMLNEDIWMGWIRGLLSMPLHCLTGALTGLRLGMVQCLPGSGPAPTKYGRLYPGVLWMWCVFPSITYHWLYDFGMFYPTVVQNLTPFQSTWLAPIQGIFWDICATMVFRVWKRRLLKADPITINCLSYSIEELPSL